MKNFDNLRGYLRSAVYREAIRHLRLRKRDRKRAPVELDAPRPNGEGTMQIAFDQRGWLARIIDDETDQQLKLRLRSALKKLTPDAQRLIELRFKRQLTLSEISKELGGAEGTLSRRLTTILIRLRADLSDSEAT